MHTTILLLLLSAFAGAIHVMAPDHWVPASILCWQRRWSKGASIGFVAIIMTLHVFLGGGLYFLLDGWLKDIRPEQLFPFAMIFVFGLMFLRGFRFSRIQDVQRLGPHGLWGALSVLTLLGPCESIVPILIKASSLGVGYLLPFAAFLFGSMVSSSILVLSGRLVWNRPFRLTQAFDWVNQRVAVLPVAAGVALGLRFLLQLS